jgi:HK97 family phage prohead protease
VPIDPNGYSPNREMVREANQALEWRREFNRGGTLVGVARARDIASGKNLPIDTVRRMSSYFARHEIDKQAEGFNRGEDGFPSAGRVAWGLWGGDAGRDWATGIIKEADDASAARSVEDNMGIEFRTAKVELRAVDATGMEFEGYAALWDSPSADGTVPEIVKSTAFNRSLSAVDRGEWDVRAYQDHDPKLLLGTTKSGTLSLRADARGLLAKIKLNPEISFHRDLAAIVKSMGNSLGMSFGFWNTAANKVNEDGVRELRDVKLVEVSALTGLAPYYPGTVSLVSVRGLAAKAGVDTDKLRDAVAALLAGEATQDHAAILASAIAASSRDVEGVPTKFPGDAPVEPKKDEPTKEVPVIDEPIENKSIAEDAGIVVEALAAAIAAVKAGDASSDEIALVVAAADAVVADDAAEAAPEDVASPDEAPIEGVPMDAAPSEGESEGESITIEIEIPRAVPRAIRERQIELARREVR